MKTNLFATAVILPVLFAISWSPDEADQNDWYQGRRGQWIQQNNAWRFRDVDGDPATRRCLGLVPGQEQARRDGLPGRHSHWVKRPNGWAFRDENNNV